MKHVAKIIAIIILTLPFTACPRPEPPVGIPAHLRQIMEANRATALPPFPEDFRERANAYLTQGLTRDGDNRVVWERPGVRLAPGQNIRDIWPSNQPASGVSREDAARDIRFLFDLMKYGYAGYQYFGGDEAFLPIRDSMLEGLAEMPDPMTSIALLEKILAPGLRPVIADNHFQLHNITLRAPPHSLRMSDDFVLRPWRSGFVTIIDNVEYRLIEAALDDGRKIEGVIPTLMREGEAAFAFGHFAQWEYWDDYRMSVLLESVESGERRQLEVRLRALRNSGSPTILLHQYEISGVPVVINRTLSESFVSPNAEREFRESGASLRGSPVVVLDLRGHGGGVPAPMLAWINAFTGSRPSGRAFGVFNLRSMSNGQGSGPAWTADIASFASALPNESLVIALIDNNVASGGDLIAGWLRELENVIFVGANTRGTLLTGGVVRNALPRSGLAVIFGAQLHLRPDFSQFEGVGFMPDLWAPPDQSLERVLAFVERYGLAR